MKKKDIINGLCARIEAASILPGSYPNVNPSAAVVAASDYLEVTFPTARREDTSLEGGTILRELGVMQVAVSVPEGTGASSAQDYADIIADLFPKGTQIAITGGLITINAAPNIPGGFSAGPDWREPVLINYLAVRN